MDIKSVGGELALIESIKKKPKNKLAVLGIGDDAALIRKDSKSFWVVTTDMLVEGDHFSFNYFSGFDLGVKSIESNFSDVAAMGGKPQFVFISLGLKKTDSPKLVKEIYRGIYSSCKKRKVDVLGGDFTHSKVTVVNVCAIGVVEKKKLCKRSDAKIGDFILVTGKLGASTVGLHLFQKKVHGFFAVKKKHLRPSSRLDISKKICFFANAVEDVSDGLASEVRNICLASKKGAIIFKEKIPISRNVKLAARKLKEDAFDYALFGGEDFELVFSVSKKNLARAKKFGTVIGKITSKKGVFLHENGKKRKLERFGFDHFA